MTQSGGRENYRGIDDTGLQGCESRGRDAGREGAQSPFFSPLATIIRSKVDTP